MIASRLRCFETASIEEFATSQVRARPLLCLCLKSFGLKRWRSAPRPRPTNKIYPRGQTILEARIQFLGHDPADTIETQAGMNIARILRRRSSSVPTSSECMSAKILMTRDGKAHILEACLDSWIVTTNSWERFSCKTTTRSTSNDRLTDGVRKAERCGAGILSESAANELN